MIHFLIIAYFLVFLLSFSIIVFILFSSMKSGKPLAYYILFFQLSLIIYACFDFVIFYRLINFPNPDPSASFNLIRISYSLFGVHIIAQFLLFLYITGSPLEKYLRIITCFLA